MTVLLGVPIVDGKPEVPPPVVSGAVVGEPREGEEGGGSGDEDVDTEEERDLQTIQPIKVPLLRVHIEADVRHAVATLTVSHVWRNPLDVPIEAMYVSPAPAGNTVVTGFDASLPDGTRVVGKFVRATEARAEYEGAKAEGKAAIYTEHVDGDAIRIAIGNIPPGGEVVTTLHMITELWYTEDAMELRLPNVVTQRYSDNPVAARPSAAAGATTATPESPAEAPFAASLHATIWSPLDVARVDVVGGYADCQVHAARDGGSHTVVTVPFLDVTRDTCLRYAIGREDRHRPVLMVDDQGTAALTRVNPLWDAPLPDHLHVFLIDRSGSMGDAGHPVDGGYYRPGAIHGAKLATQAAIGELPDGFRVAIISFGTIPKVEGQGITVLDAVTREQLRATIDAMTADMGGTSMWKAIDAAMALVETLPADTPHAKMFILTDGNVDLAQRNDILAKAVDRVCINVFTIGTNTCGLTARRLADRTGGVAVYVTPDNLRPAVHRAMHTLREAWSPCVAGFPKVIGCVGGALTLRYAAADAEMDYTRAATTVYRVPNNLLTALHAGRKLADWDISSDITDYTRAAELSIAHGILSRHVSIVGVSQLPVVAPTVGRDGCGASPVSVVVPQPVAAACNWFAANYGGAGGCGAGPDVPHRGANHEFLRQLVGGRPAQQKVAGSIPTGAKTFLSPFGIRAVPLVPGDIPAGPLDYMAAFDAVFQGPRTRERDCWVGAALMYGMVHEEDVVHGDHLHAGLLATFGLAARTLRTGDHSSTSALRKRIVARMCVLTAAFLRVLGLAREPADAVGALLGHGHHPTATSFIAIEQVDEANRHAVVLARDREGRWWLYDGTLGDKGCHFQGGRLREEYTRAVVEKYRVLQVDFLV